MSETPSKRKFSEAVPEQQQDVYKRLDEDVLPAKKGRCVTVKQVVSRIAHGEASASAVIDELLYKPVMMRRENKTPSAQHILDSKEQNPLKSRLGKKMSRKQRRAMGLDKIPTEQCKYDIFSPLNQLWMDYINFVTEGMNSPTAIEQAILQCDLHGALVQVTKSKCPSFIGLKGIVIQETQQTFKIITQKDELKILPKSHSVFKFESSRFSIFIFGERFCIRSADRSTKKFKNANTLSLV